jgi:galactokinase
MYQSHEGLSNEYEVSCPELDLLVDLTRKESTILGARMMGGGFGGCTINLSKTTEAESVVSKLMNEYQKQTQIQAESYLVSIEDGVKFI